MTFRILSFILKKYDEDNKIHLGVFATYKKVKPSPDIILSPGRTLPAFPGPSTACLHTSLGTTKQAKRN